MGDKLAKCDISFIKKVMVCFSVSSYRTQLAITKFIASELIKTIKKVA